MGAHLLIEIDDFIRKRSCGPPRELQDAKRAGGQVQSPGGGMPSGPFMVVLCDLFGGLGSVGLGSLWAGRGGANIVLFFGNPSVEYFRSGVDHCVFDKCHLWALTIKRSAHICG